jgi:hypothetical protein
MSRCPRLAKAALLLIVMVTFVAVSTLALAADDEMVAFNTKSHKYHCLSCQYAVKCTQNCIQIKRSDAIARGGVPCKVCGGSCKAKPSSTTSATPQVSEAAPHVGAFENAGDGTAIDFGGAV